MGVLALEILVNNARIASHPSAWFALYSHINRFAAYNGAEAYSQKVVAGPFSSQGRCERWISRSGDPGYFDLYFCRDMPEIDAERLRERSSP